MHILVIVKIENGTFYTDNKGKMKRRWEALTFCKEKYGTVSINSKYKTDQLALYNTENGEIMNIIGDVNKSLSLHGGIATYMLEHRQSGVVYKDVNIEKNPCVRMAQTFDTKGCKLRDDAIGFHRGEKWTYVIDTTKYIEEKYNHDKPTLYKSFYDELSDKAYSCIENPLLFSLDENCERYVIGFSESGEIWRGIVKIEKNNTLSEDDMARDVHPAMLRYSLHFAKELFEKKGYFLLYGKWKNLEICRDIDLLDRENVVYVTSPLRTSYAFFLQNCLVSDKEIDLERKVEKLNEMRMRYQCGRLLIQSIYFDKVMKENDINIVKEENVTFEEMLKSQSIPSIMCRRFHYKGDIDMWEGRKTIISYNEEGRTSCFTGLKIRFE